MHLREGGMNNGKHWPVSYRCPAQEAKRQGRHDDLKPTHWIWFSVLFGLFVVGGAVNEILTYLGV